MSKNASNTVNQNQVSNNTISVTSYETPEVFIRIEHLHIYAAKRRFELLLSMSPDGKKWSDQRHITGGITDELRRFVSNAYEQSVQVESDNEEGFEWVKTGNYLTGCQKYLTNIGLGEIIHEEQALSMLTFEAWNRSPHYEECPFRLFLRENGEGTLTLVDWPSQKKYDIVDPETGKMVTRFGHWKNEDGKIEKYKPEDYRRLVVEMRHERKLYNK